MIIYADESGDLGWSFDMPYGSGGSSRHLTIGAVFVESSCKHYPKRIIKDLYIKLKVPTSTEIKWVDIDRPTREWLAHRFVALKSKLGNKILYKTMTVKKENVLEHIRKDPNKLYNYMMRLLLVSEMAKHPVVTLIPDPRSIKVASGNSMHDYLQTELWFSANAATQLTTTPLDSSKCHGLQFADLLSGMIQTHYEKKRSECFQIIQHTVTTKTLFFN
ncbi:MAG: DUF3800 domain-containing protein [Burkholderiales bacterium]|uniref:DUF3800 domain-containing protein n=1 Tax=Limnobacter sp. TaxID=2003368 RepID=UPI0039BC3FC6|nr:DUF3800 domain-containing protein [Burkholderiales bacterium]